MTQRCWLQCSGRLYGQCFQTHLLCTLWILSDRSQSSSRTRSFWRTSSHPHLQLRAGCSRNPPQSKHWPSLPSFLLLSSLHTSSIGLWCAPSKKHRLPLPLFLPLRCDLSPRSFFRHRLLWRPFTLFYQIHSSVSKRLLPYNPIVCHLSFVWARYSCIRPGSSWSTCPRQHLLHCQSTCPQSPPSINYVLSLAASLL